MGGWMEDQTDDVNLPEISAPDIPAAEIEPSSSMHSPKHKRISWGAFISILLAFALGLSSGYFAWGRQTTQVDTAARPDATPAAEHPHTVTLDWRRLRNK
jgi:hypothetical protein